MSAERRVFQDVAIEAAFRRDGFVVVDLLDAGALSRLAAVWDSFNDPVQNLWFSSTIMSRDVAYREAVHRAVAAEVEPATASLFDRYRFCFCSFLGKAPAPRPAGTEEIRGRVPGDVELHQDWAFVDETRYQSVALWCPLIDVDENNGGMLAVPGSHEINKHARTPLHPFPYPQFLPIIEERYMRSVPVRAGQAFIFTQTLFHGSLPNYSARPRVAAGGMAVPEESPLRFYIPGLDQHQNELAVYEVADDYYRQYQFGTRPAHEPIGHVPIAVEPLTEEALHAHLRART